MIIPKNVQDKLSSRDIELIEMPPLADSFPMSFANGMSWSGLDCHCDQCKVKMPESYVHGMLQTAYPKVAILEAIGYCEICNNVTRFNIRLYDDMRLSLIHDGKWATVQTWPFINSPLYHIYLFLKAAIRVLLLFTKLALVTFVSFLIGLLAEVTSILKFIYFIIIKKK